MSLSTKKARDKILFKLVDHKYFYSKLITFKTGINLVLEIPKRWQSFSVCRGSHNVRKFSSCFNAVFSMIKASASDSRTETDHCRQ